MEVIHNKKVMNDMIVHQVMVMKHICKLFEETE